MGVLTPYRILRLDSRKALAMDWTDEVIERLRSLWAEGHSTAEIGRRLGVSKNAVVGKAHRLALPPRPSPIRRNGAAPGSKRGVPRPVGATLPSLAPAHPAVAAVIPAERPAPLDDARFRPAPRAIPRDAAPRDLGPRDAGMHESGTRERRGRRIPCCWPIGEPGTKSFRFCDGASVAGKPYCPDHAALAYVKIRDRREEAA